MSWTDSIGRCSHYGCFLDCLDAPWNQSEGKMTRIQILRRYAKYLRNVHSRPRSVDPMWVYAQSREGLGWLNEIRFGKTT